MKANEIGATSSESPACRVREWRLGQDVSPRPGFHPLPHQIVHEVFPHTAFRQPSSRSMRGPVSHVPTTTRHRFGPECAVDNPLATGHILRGSFRDLWNWWNWPCRACTVTYLPTPARLKQGAFPPIELCCLDDQRYYFPLRLLTRRPPGLRIHVLIPGVTKDVGLRPRETSLVALPAFPTFRSPYAGEFFEAASPDSSPLPWPSL